MAVKKVEDVQLSTEEKRCCIEKEHPQLSIKKQCELIRLNRSSYYYQPCILNIKGFEVALSTYPQVSIILEPLDLAQKNNCWPVGMWIKRTIIKNEYFVANL